MAWEDLQPEAFPHPREKLMFVPLVLGGTRGDGHSASDLITLTL